MNYIQEDEMLGIRPMTLEDSALIVRWRNQDWVRKNYVYRETFTLEGQEQYFHTQIETGKVQQFIVCEKTGHSGQEGRPIGCTVLNDFNEETGHCEYGMFLGEQDATGKGYSARMVRLTLQHAFYDLKLTESVCRIFTDNPASYKGCERGGFTIVETLPDVECSDGTKKDMYLLRATADTFR